MTLVLYLIIDKGNQKVKKFLLGRLRLIGVDSKIKTDIEQLV